MSFRTRTWQITFLIALVTLLILLAVSRGLERFIATATAAGIVLAVINALLGVRPRDEGDRVSKAARELLNDHHWLRLLTIVAILADLGLAVRLFSVQRVRATTWVVRGAVVAEESKPVPFAEVTLRLPGGAVEVTKSHANGEFAFTLRRKELPKHATFSVETPELVGSTEAELQSHVIIRARRNDAPIRVVYYLFGNTAVDLILLQANGKAVKSVFGDSIRFIENDVLAALRKLAKRYTTRSEVTDFNRATELESEDVELQTRSTLFVGSTGEIEEALWPVELTWQPSHALLRTLKSPGWSAEYYVSEETEEVKLRFARPARIADMQNLSDLPLAQFYRSVTRKVLPPGFASVVVEDETFSFGCGDQEDVPSTRARFEAPRMAVRVAVLENFSEQSVHVSALRVRSVSDDAIRTPLHHQRLIDSARPLELPLLEHSMVMAPHEKIAIPVELVFRDDFSVAGAYEEDTERLDALISAADRELRSKSSIEFAGVTIPKSVAVRSVETPSPPRPNEFLWGPSLRIEAAHADGIWRPLRPPDRDSHIVVYTPLGVVGEGSCPYLFTWIEGEWQSNGVFLYAASSKERERSEQIRLPAFEGLLRIVERDPETSYIDELVVSAVSPRGLRRCIPRNATLALRDGRYLVLQRGESLDVAYDCPGGLAQDAQYTATASGYYMPLRRGSRP
jgi:hypothetical protein